MATTLTKFMTEQTFNGFRSQPYYSREGDFLTYYFTNTDFFAERVDDVLTIYRSMSDSKTVGFKMKGVRKLVKKLGDLGVLVSDDKGIRLGLLIIAGLAETDNPTATEFYRRVQRKTFAKTTLHNLPEWSSLDDLPEVTDEAMCGSSWNL